MTRRRVSIAAADRQRVALRIDFSKAPDSNTADRNAKHATTVQRMLQAQSPHELRFAALEEAVVDLSDVVRVCDEHGIEFEHFAAFDDLLFGPGFDQLEDDEEAHGRRVAEDDFEPGAGLSAPLEGERGGHVHLLDASAAGDTHLCVAVGKYWLLFERPLPALGAFRAARSRGPESCAAAADGVTYCLCLLGLREEATAPLALQYWANVHPPLSEAAGASSFLATLAHVVPEPPEAATAILRNASRFLRTRAVSAARRLLRQWLPAWLERGGGDAERSPQTGATALRRELGDADGWLGAALRGSNVFACAALEPVLSACRRQVLESQLALLAALGRAPPAADAARLASAAASIACHMLAVGFCVPEAEEERRAVDEACAALATGAAGRRLRAAAASGGAALVEDAALLMAVAMYRPLSAVAPPGLHALEASQLAAVPLADEAVDAHLRRPKARASRAEALPRVTLLDEASMPVEAFYHATLYPLWHVPETGDAPRTSIGACLRRHYPWLKGPREWPFDDEVGPLRVCIAGAGSGHQVAQAAQTLSHCEIVALDLSATSLAYAEGQMVSLLPHEAPRVSWVVGDLMRLGDGGPAESGVDAATPTMADATTDQTTESHRLRYIAPKFHLVMCFGVVHHCADPAVALRRLAASTLLPGGVLQLGTYSAFWSRSWRPAARRLLHRINPAVAGEDGELLRQPTPAELRAIRRRLFELAQEPTGTPGSERGGGEADVRGPLFDAGGVDMGAACVAAMPSADDERASPQTLSRECATAKMLLRFEEFYSASGALDLLFHPQEATFTLLQLHAMLEAAGLEAVGVYFLDAEADRQARAAFARAEGGARLEHDPRMSDLRTWHALERRDPALFGRMHFVYCRLKHECSD